MSIAWASVILGPSGLIIHPYYQEKPGSLFGSGPYIGLPISANPDQVGSALIAARGQSRGDVDIPSGMARAQERWVAIGVNSSRKEALYTHQLFIEFSDGEIRITPSESYGEKREWNFRQRPDLKIVVPADVTATHLGLAIRRGLAICRELTIKMEN